MSAEIKSSSKITFIVSRSIHRLGELVLVQIYLNSCLDFAREMQTKSPCSPVKQPPDQHGPSRKTSIASRGNNMSLDKLTGDSLLFYSYSTASGGSGLTPDSQLGE